METLLNKGSVLEGADNNGDCKDKAENEITESTRKDAILDLVLVSSEDITENISVKNVRGSDHKL